MDYDFWHRKKTFSLYEAGFLLSKIDPPPLLEDVSNPEPHFVEEDFGFKIPTTVKIYKGLLSSLMPKKIPYPKALTLTNVSNRRGYSSIPVFDYSALSKKPKKDDFKFLGYYIWRYQPVDLTMQQKALLEDLIMAIQDRQLPCIDWGLIPIAGHVEVTRYSVQFLLDTIISREALYAWALETLPELPKFLCLSPETVKPKSESDEFAIAQSNSFRVKRIDGKTVSITFHGKESIITGKGCQLIYRFLENPGTRFSVRDLIAWENPGGIEEAPDGLEAAGGVKEKRSAKQMNAMLDILTDRVKMSSTLEEKETANQERKEFIAKIKVFNGAYVKGGKVYLGKIKNGDPIERAIDSYRNSINRSYKMIEDSALREFLYANIQTGNEFYYIEDYSVDWVIIK
jgi:hypothetical protein